MGKQFLPPVFAITLIFAAIYATGHQVYRQSANDPQMQISEDGARALEDGKAIRELANNDQIDIAKSLAPFVMVVDQTKNIVSTNAVLDGVTPTIPSGVFDYAKDHGQNRLTWEPKKDVRLAVFVTYYNKDGKSGFVVSGRNLREIESRVSDLGVTVGIAWAATLFGTLTLMMFFDRSWAKKRA